MKHFYCGCRVDQIRNLTASDDPKFPTRIHFLNGIYVNVAVPGEDAVRKIEAILTANREEEIVAESRIKDTRPQLLAEIAVLTREVEILTAQRSRIAYDAPAISRLAVALDPVLRGQRNYLRSDEKEVVTKALDELGARHA